MSTHEPERASGPPALTSLPAFEDLPVGPDGALDRGGVREALDAYRRHVAQLQAQLRVAQGAPGEPSGHSIRMDALHLIRGAAEFADQLERDAQRASAAQLGRTEEEVRRRQRELQERERQIESFRDESERQRAEIVNAAQREARETTGAASASAAVELREAQAKGARLLEQSRHQAMELTNAARAEVEQTLDWARAQAGVILARAQEGAEQLLRAAGLGDEALAEVTRSIVASAEASTESPAPPVQRPTDTVPVETFEREDDAPAADEERPSAESARERPDGGEPRT